MLAGRGVQHGEYGAPEGLVSSASRCAPTASAAGSVVEGSSHNDFARERIRVTTEELESEREDVRKLGLVS